jgi:lysophospholipase L1-like esterase
MASFNANITLTTTTTTGATLVYEETWDTLSLSNYVTGSTGRWQLGGRTFQPSGYSELQCFEPNPFNPATPITLASVSHNFYLQAGSPPTPGGVTKPNPMRIMPMGDSITEGTVAGGYRAPLYTLLAGDNDNPQFVGSNNSNPGSLPSNQQNHEGHGGWISLQLTDLVNNQGIIQTYTPDVVLLLIGTNDMFGASSTDPAGLKTRIAALCDAIISARPAIKILLSTLLHRVDDTGGEINSINALIPGIASARSNNVKVVDLANQLSLSDLSSDGLHPSQGGYNKMAAGWETAINNLYSGAGTSVIITPTSGGSVKDESGNTWTLNSAGNLIENGNVVSGGGGTSALTVVNGVIWAKSASTSQWHTYENLLTMTTMATPSQYLAACNNQPYVSAWMSTRDIYSRTYGYFEASIAIDSIQGISSAFWLQPQNGQWPPEIDMVEYDYTPSGSAAVNNVFDLAGNGLNNWFDYTTDWSQYHVWAVNWQPDFCTFYLDGVVTAKTATPAGYTLPMYIILSMVVPGNDGFVGPIVNPAGLPAHMRVKYVRVWDQKP